MMWYVRLNVLYLDGIGRVGATTPALLGRLVMANDMPVRRSGLLLLTGVGSLSFGGTSALLHSALHFLQLLSGLLLGLILEEFVSSEEKLLVIGLSSINAIVDESVSGRSATTEFGLHAEDGDLLFLAFELGGQLLLDSSFGDTTAIRVDDLERALLSGKKGVVDELLQVEYETLDHVN